MKIVLSLAAVLTLAGISGSAFADVCKALALRDVPAIDDPQYIIKRGDYETGVSIYRIDKNTGEASFCQHGGLCYPTQIIENGTKVEALRLTNCKIETGGYDIGEFVDYSLKVIESTVTANEYKIDRLTRQLIEQGLCNGCAANIANLYVNQPASQCARLTQKALDGDPAALEQLKDFPEFCQLR